MTGTAQDLAALLRSVTALGAILALLLGARWLLLRHQARGPKTRDRAALEIVASLPLDARHRMLIVRRGSAEIVLAVGPQGVSPLAPWRDSSLDAARREPAP